MFFLFFFFGLCDAEQLAKDVEMFAQHAGRKSVNMEDVILSGNYFRSMLEYFYVEL